MREPLYTCCEDGMLSQVPPTDSSGLCPACKRPTPNIIGPTYYVRHPDETYTAADPQPFPANPRRLRVWLTQFERAYEHCDLADYSIELALGDLNAAVTASELPPLEPPSA